MLGHGWLVTGLCALGCSLALQAMDCNFQEVSRFRVHWIIIWGHGQGGEFSCLIVHDNADCVVCSLRHGRNLNMGWSKTRSRLVALLKTLSVYGSLFDRLGGTSGALPTMGSVYGLTISTRGWAIWTGRCFWYCLVNNEEASLYVINGKFIYISRMISGMISLYRDYRASTMCNHCNKLILMVLR